MIHLVDDDLNFFFKFIEFSAMQLCFKHNCIAENSMNLKKKFKSSSTKCIIVHNTIVLANKTVVFNSPNIICLALLT